MDNNTSSISNIGTYEKTSYRIPSGTDLNTLIYSGIYMGDGLVNAPGGYNWWFHIEVIRHNDVYTIQKAYPFTNPTCPVYIRTQNNGTWYGWRLFNQGTANTAQVLSGYTFSSANGVNLSGSMVNRPGTSHASNVHRLYDNYVFEIDPGAYLTNGDFFKTRPEIMMNFGEMANCGVGLNIDHTINSVGYIQPPFTTSVLKLTYSGNYCIIFGGSMGYSNSQINGYGKIYSPSLGKLIDLQYAEGGCAVSSGGGFIAVSKIQRFEAGTTVCGKIDNSYVDTNAGNGYANLRIVAIHL